MPVTAPWPIWARYVSGRAGEGAGPRGGRNLVGAHCGAARRTPGTPRGKLWSLRPRTKPLCVGAPSSERGGTASQCKARRRLARRKPGDPPAPGGTNEKPRCTGSAQRRGRLWAQRIALCAGRVCGTCRGHERRPSGGSSTGRPGYGMGPAGGVVSPGGGRSPQGTVTGSDKVLGMGTCTVERARPPGAGQREPARSAGHEGPVGSTECQSQRPCHAGGEVASRLQGHAERQEWTGPQGRAQTTTSQRQRARPASLHAQADVGHGPGPPGCVRQRGCGFIRTLHDPSNTRDRVRRLRTVYEE